MFYTYLWLRYDGTPYYVGKGTQERAYVKDNHKVNPPCDRSLIILQEFDTEEEAFQAERFLIEFYGRKDIRTGVLRNMSSGGLGGVNSAMFTDSYKQKMRESLIGRTLTEEWKTKISSALLGRRKSSEHAKNISLSHKGKPWSEKRRAAQIARRHERTKDIRMDD